MQNRKVNQNLIDLLQRANDYGRGDTAYLATVVEVLKNGENITVRKLGDSVDTYGVQVNPSFQEDGSLYNLPAIGSTIIVQVINGQDYITFMSEIEKTYIISNSEVVVRGDDNVRIESSQVAIFNNSENLKSLLEDLTSELSDLNTNLTTLVSTISTLNSNYTPLDSAVKTGIDTSLTSLTTLLSTAATAITSVSGRISNLLSES